MKTISSKKIWLNLVFARVSGAGAVGKVMLKPEASEEKERL